MTAEVKHRVRMRTEDIAAEVEFLWGTDHPDNIAARLGFSRTDSLTRALYRAQRPDLAVLFPQTRRGH